MAVFRHSRIWPLAMAIVAAATTQVAVAHAPGPAGQTSLERGRYLVKIGGCNHCHTAGYTQSASEINF